MSERHDPTRLRDLDPVFEQVIERAHAYTPSARSIEAVVAAVERASSGMTIPGAHSSAGAGHSTSMGSSGFISTSFGGVGGSALLKSALLKLSVFAAMSSSVWWVLNSGRPVQPARAPAIASSSSMAAAPSEPRVAAPAPASVVVGRGGEVAPQTSAVTSQPVPLADSASAMPAQRGQPVPSHPSAIQRPAVPSPAQTEPNPALPETWRAPAQAAPRVIKDGPALRATGAKSYRAGTRVDAPTRSDNLTSRRDRARSSRGNTTPNDDSIESELELLEQAQQALRDAPLLALELTARHRREYPKGGFIQEREQIAIEALFDLGDTAALRARASRFRTSFPRSAHNARIEELLESTHSSAQQP